MHCVLTRSAFCAALTLSVGAAFAAEAYPARPVRLVVPYSPGGAADVPGRIVAQRLSELLGQQIVVDNRPGAGGLIGAETTARAAPDGYTLLLIANTHYVTSALRDKMPFKPVDDFTHITAWLSAPSVRGAGGEVFLSASPKEFVEFSRAEAMKWAKVVEGERGAGELAPQPTVAAIQSAM